MHRPSCTVNLSLLSWLKAFWLILYQRKCCFLCDLLKTVKCTLLKFAYGVSRMRPNWAMAFVTGASGESCGIPLKHPAPSRHIATSLWSHSPGLFMFRNFQESQCNTSTNQFQEDTHCISWFKWAGWKRKDFVVCPFYLLSELMRIHIDVYTLDNIIT